MKIKLGTLRKLIREEVENVMGTSVEGPNKNNTVSITVDDEGPCLTFLGGSTWIWELIDDDYTDEEIENLTHEKIIEVLDGWPTAKFVDDEMINNGAIPISEYKKILNGLNYTQQAYSL